MLVDFNEEHVVLGFLGILRAIGLVSGKVEWKRVVDCDLGHRYNELTWVAGP